MVFALLDDGDASRPPIPVLAAGVRDEAGLRSLVEDLAGCDTDELIGWTERKGSETIKNAGYLDGFEVSRDDAEALIMQARVSAGWIEAPVKEPEIAGEAAIGGARLGDDLRQHVVGGRVIGLTEPAETPTGGPEGDHALQAARIDRREEEGLRTPARRAGRTELFFVNEG
mgnify:CR=1 FL=1